MMMVKVLVVVKMMIVGVGVIGGGGVDTNIILIHGQWHLAISNLLDSVALTWL